jgi:hypothetical protein
VAMYWHIGDTTIRLRRVSAFSLNGENKEGMVHKKKKTVPSVQRKLAAAVAGFAAVIAFSNKSHPIQQRCLEAVLDSGYPFFGEECA